jgi:UDP-N-acetylmuramoyl-tripeptide--D-alanyl-D-alanine ligase
MLFTLAQAADWLALKTVTTLHPNTPIEGVSIDTRTLQPGDLFVALGGNTVDGHDYITEAAAKGASAALVERPVKTTLPLLQVPNTLQALGKLALAYRAQFSLPVIGLTGSVGKTTVKEILVHLLGQAYSVLYSIGNQNNEIGVPLTLLRLSTAHQVAVIEMGARQIGDIAYLADLAKPTVGLITNIGVAHIEIFGGVAQIAQGKTELFRALPPNGTAILAMDDPHLAPWLQRLQPSQRGVQVRMKTAGNADIQAVSCVFSEASTQFTLITAQGQYPVQLNIPGEHNVANALLAAGAAWAIGLSWAQIQQGLNSFQPQVSGRLTLKKGRMGAVIIDDSYNANPVSMQAALNVLARYPGEQIVVMGDMLELGETAIQQHQSIGRTARDLGIKHFFGIGPLSAEAVSAFGPTGKHLETLTQLLEALEALLIKYEEKAIILVKGSRGMKMERVVTALC